MSIRVIGVLSREGFRVLTVSGLLLSETLSPKLANPEPEPDPYLRPRPSEEAVFAGSRPEFFVKGLQSSVRS